MQDVAASLGIPLPSVQVWWLLGAASSLVRSNHRLRVLQARQFQPAEDIVHFDLVLVMDKFTAADALKEVGSRLQLLSYNLCCVLSCTL